MMSQNLVDLYRLTGDAEWLELAVRDLRRAADRLGDRRMSLAALHTAALDLLSIERAAAALAASVAAPDADTPVAISAAWSDAGTLALTLDIDEDVHLNAHEVNSDFLIPTAVELIGPGRLEAHYPAGDERRYAYSALPVLVYEGRVFVRLEVSGLTDASALRLRYQACTDTLCLRPTEVRVEIPPRPNVPADRDS